MLYSSAYYIYDSSGNIVGRLGYGSDNDGSPLFLGASTADAAFFKVTSTGAYIKGEVVVLLFLVVLPFRPALRCRAYLLFFLVAALTV